MKSAGREIIDVLEKAVEVDWFRCAGFGFDEVASNTVFVVWRFKIADGADELANRVVQALRSVLGGFSGNMSWMLKQSGRNWVLLPTRLQELEESGRFGTDGELLDHLRREEPSFGRKAHEDLSAIADGLAHQLRV